MQKRLFRMRPLLALLMLVAISVVIVPVTPQSQTKREPVRTTVVQRRNLPQVGRVDPSALKVNERPPVQNKPLEMEELLGKRPAANPTIKIDKEKIAPLSVRNAGIYHVLSGKSVILTAAKYSEQMNALEKEINKKGYSLRDAEKKNKPQETIMRPEKILQQVRNIPKLAINPQTSLKLEAIAAAHREYIRKARSGAPLANGTYARTMPSFTTGRPMTLIHTPGSISLPASTTGPPKTRPDLTGGTYTPGADNPDNQPAFGNPWFSVQASGRPGHGETVAFYIHKEDGSPLAKKYYYQIVRATEDGDNFGTTDKGRYQDNGPGGWTAWQNPIGLVPGGSGFTTISPLAPMWTGGDPNFFYFLINFNSATKVAVGETHKFLVRVIPMNDDNSLAGYPSNAVAVTYGPNPRLPSKGAAKPTPAPLPTLKKGSYSKPMFPDSPDHPGGIYTLGDDNIVSIALSGALAQNQDSATSDASIKVNLDGHILGMQVPILDAEAKGRLTMPQGTDSYHISTPGTAHGEMHFKLFGLEQCTDHPVCTPADSLDGITAGKEFPLYSPVDFALGAEFQVGPIDVSIEGGVKITFTGNLSLGAQVPLIYDPLAGGLFSGGKVLTGELTGENVPIYFYLNAGPGVKATAYVTAAGGIGADGFDIVEAGATFDVDIVDLIFSIGIENNTYYGKISKFQMFTGHAYAFAKAGICPLCHEWDWDIWDSDAGTDFLANDPNKGTLFSGKLGEP
jgi:hypothetical protein